MHNLTKGINDFCKQVNLGKTLLSDARGSQREFEFNNTTTIGESQDIVSQPIVSVVTRLSFRSNVGRGAS